LNGISKLPAQKKQYFDECYKAYGQRTKAPEAAFDSLVLDVNLMQSILQSGRRKRLLRYPVLLATAEMRTRLFKVLAQKGVGISAMYGSELSKVVGVDQLSLSIPDMPNARSFSQRFLTLPVHPSVTPYHINIISDELGKLR
jgi:dTDP-4-amino-4,6-dideoxygalactose transaminase